jgi:hypothetical protein
MRGLFGKDTKLISLWRRLRVQFGSRSTILIPTFWSLVLDDIFTRGLVERPINGKGSCIELVTAFQTGLTKTSLGKVQDNIHRSGAASLVGF